MTEKPYYFKFGKNYIIKKLENKEGFVHFVFEDDEGIQRTGITDSTDCNTVIDSAIGVLLEEARRLS